MPDNQFLTLLDKEKPNILKMLPAEDERARERWWALTYELTHNSALRMCADKNPMSLLNAVKKFADWGLIPDGEEGFINVYNTKQDDGSWLPEASPEAMYKGIIRRGVEAEVISHCVGDVLREGDTFSVSIGPKGRMLEVVPAPAKRGRKLIGAYAIFWLPNGLMDYELFDEDDIQRRKDASLRNAQRKNKDAKLTPAWQYSEAEMAKAKVIKCGMKRMRGKRDTDAGRRFSEVTADTQYDVETESVELPPDNKPTNAGVAQGSEHADSHNGESGGVGSSPAPGSKLTLKPDNDRKLLTPQQQKWMQGLWKEKYGSIAGFAKFLGEQFGGRDDVELLFDGEDEEFRMLLQREAS